MKDQARIAAEQRLQQTKATLQHEIQSKDHDLSTLHQLLKDHKQEIVSAQHHFQYRLQVLEHQMKARQQDLENQIQAKEEENARLEQQLHQKGEQIQAKEEEKAKLEQQLHQKGKQI